MHFELEALKNNGTWKLIYLPPNVKCIGSTCHYEIKHKDDDSMERYKKILVINGYSQIKGLFFYTFLLVEKSSTIRVLLELASIKNLHLLQFDMNNAFLYVDLEENVYMIFPQ